jgi:hypothetical protein
MSPSLKTLSGETQRIGRRPLAIDAVRQAINAGLAFIDRLVFGYTLEDTSATDEAEAYLEEARVLLADTGASDRLAAAIAEWKTLEAA